MQSGLKLGTVETSATADQTAAEIKDSLESLAGNGRLNYSAVRNGPPVDAKRM